MRDGEIWFGGRIDQSLTKVQFLWDKIEEHSDYRREQYKKWPLPLLEKRTFLGISTNHHTHENDCEDDECAEHTRPVIDHSGAITGRRAYHVNYWDIALPGISVDDVRNRETLIDIRDAVVFDLETVCSCKDDH